MQQNLFTFKFSKLQQIVLLGSLSIQWTSIVYLFLLPEGKEILFCFYLSFWLNENMFIIA